VKFIPTATLGIIAREYEQKQLAFLIQTLGANSPLTPILMQGVLKNSSLSNREQMIEQMAKANQPNPEQQQLQQHAAQLDLAQKQAEVQKTQAEAQKTQVETQLAPDIAKAKIVSALTNNLNEADEDKSFAQRVEIANISLKEKDIESNERIAKMQVAASLHKSKTDKEYVEQASQAA
jgi:hypothetical protein